MNTLKNTCIAVTALLMMSACNQLSGSRSMKVANTQLSIQTASASSGSGNPNVMLGNSTAATDSTSIIKIDTAKILIDKIEFHGVEEGSDSTGYYQRKREYEMCHDSSGVIEADSTEFESGPMVLDLNLDTTVTKIGINNLPKGTYGDVSFLIHPPLPNETVIDSDFVSDSARYSIVIKGFYKGKHFTFNSGIRGHVNVILNPPLTLSDSLNTYNATIKVDVSNWFTGRNGQILDPTNKYDEWAIRWNILRSFHAFEDNDRDGHEDHGGISWWNNFSSNHSGWGGDHHGDHHGG